MSNTLRTMARAISEPVMGRRVREPKSAVQKARKSAPGILAAEAEKRVKRGLRKGLTRLGYRGSLLDSEVDRLAALSSERARILAV